MLGYLSGVYNRYHNIIKTIYWYCCIFKAIMNGSNFFLYVFMYIVVIYFIFQNNVNGQLISTRRRLYETFN